MIFFLPRKDAFEVSDAKRQRIRDEQTALRKGKIPSTTIVNAKFVTRCFQIQWMP